jgi:hypothetical protein
MKIDLFDIYWFFEAEKKLRESPALDPNDPEFRRYMDFVRNYRPMDVNQFVEFVRDVYEHFEERVFEESGLLRQDYFDAITTLDSLLLEDDETPDYQI